MIGTRWSDWNAAVTAAALAGAVSVLVACGAESEAPSSTSSGEGGAGGASGDGGAGGLAAPPANYDAGQPCTTFPQAGCAPSDTCAIATMDGRAACQNAGTGPVGAYCADDYDCGAGLVCIGSTCHAQCHAPADCGGVAQGCDQIFDGASEQPISGYLTCSTPCSPADPQNTAQDPSLAGCPGGFLCYTRTAPQGSTDCFPGGPVGLGGACDSDCAPGLVCLSDGTNATCQPYCVMGVTSCNCLPFAQPQYVGIGESLLEVGYCG